MKKTAMAFVMVGVVAVLASACSGALGIAGPDKTAGGGVGATRSVADDRPVGDPRNSVPTDAVQNLSAAGTGQWLEDGSEAVNIAFTPVVNIASYEVTVTQKTDLDTYVVVDFFVIEGRTDVTRYYREGTFHLSVVSRGVVGAQTAETDFSVSRGPEAAQLCTPQDDSAPLVCIVG